jgi:hypothetical protein
MAGLGWTIDEKQRVDLKVAVFKGMRLLVNGREAAVIKMRKNGVTPFKLDDGREATLTLDRGMGVQVDWELRVQGQVVLNDRERKQRSCLKCGKGAKAGEKFCEKCGAALPEGQTQRKLVKLRSARATILAVSAMFLVFGAFMYFAQQETAEKALQNLSSYKDSDPFPKPIGGVTYTVAELREKIQLEPLQSAGLNGFLCLVMLGLYFYSKRSPLVALVIALAVYGSVLVLNAILDPATIGQGLYMKLIVLAVLVKGVQSALELRKVDA